MNEREEMDNFDIDAALKAEGYPANPKELVRIGFRVGWQARAAQPQGEAVAYRYRVKMDGALGPWQFYEGGPFNRNDVIEEPLYTSPTIPPGFKLVPVEPTDAMLKIMGGWEDEEWEDVDQEMKASMKRDWLAAIAASPNPPLPITE